MKITQEEQTIVRTALRICVKWKTLRGRCARGSSGEYEERAAQGGEEKKLSLSRLTKDGKSCAFSRKSRRRAIPGSRLRPLSHDLAPSRSPRAFLRAAGDSQMFAENRTRGTYFVNNSRFFILDASSRFRFFDEAGLRCNRSFSESVRNRARLIHFRIRGPRLHESGWIPIEESTLVLRNRVAVAHGMREVRLHGEA